MGDNDERLCLPANDFVGLLIAVLNPRQGIAPIGCSGVRWKGLQHHGFVRSHFT